MAEIGGGEPAIDVVDIHGDTRRLEWLLRNLSDAERQRLNLATSAGGLYQGRLAIDRARAAQAAEFQRTRTDLDPLRTLPLIPPAKKLDQKPTAAQLRWLEAIGEGRVRRQSRDWDTGMRNMGGIPSRSTYVMTSDLRRAGWIDHEVEPGGFGTYKIVLTPAGIAQLEKSKEKKERARP